MRPVGWTSCSPAPPDPNTPLIPELLIGVAAANVLVAVELLEDELPTPGVMPAPLELGDLLPPADPLGVVVADDDELLLFFETGPAAVIESITLPSTMGLLAAKSPKTVAKLPGERGSEVVAIAKV